MKVELDQKDIDFLNYLDKTLCSGAGLDGWAISFPKTHIPALKSWARLMKTITNEERQRVPLEDRYYSVGFIETLRYFFTGKTRGV